MAAPSLVQYIFLPFFSLLMSTEIFSATVSHGPNTQSLICTNPDYQYARHPLDCSRWFRCSHGKPLEMPPCVDRMTFSMNAFSCLPRRNENNDCVSTCMFDGKRRFLGETFVGKNSCEKCVCQNNRGDVICIDACLTKGASCSSDGRTYQFGQYYMSSDGCNTCRCEEKGSTKCTDIKCQTNKVTCNHEESVYVAGETFAHLDGQHTCTCRLDGIVSCSLSRDLQTEDEMNCFYDRKWYRAGKVFLSVDHCNQCECLDSGHVTCTKFNCSSPRQPLYGYKDQVTCIYNEKEYKEGESFLALDGCNYCNCDLYGRVQCTHRNCKTTPVTMTTTMTTPTILSSTTKELILQQSSSEHPSHSLRRISTASENNIPIYSSSDSLSTKATDINIPKFFAINESMSSVTEPIGQTREYSRFTIPLAPETPPTPPDKSEILEESTMASTLESTAQHSTLPSLFVSAVKNSASHKDSTISETTSTLKLQNINFKNVTLIWNLNLHTKTFELPPGLFSRTKSKNNNFASSESETLLSNTDSLSLLNISTGATKNSVHRKDEYSKSTSPDVPKTGSPLSRDGSTFETTTPGLLVSAVPFEQETIANEGVTAERSLSRDRSTFKTTTTSGLIASVVPFEPETIAKEGATTELGNSETIEKSMDNAEVTADSVRNTSALQNESTTSGIHPSYTNPQTQSTVKNELKESNTFSRFSVTSVDETRQSEISTSNKTGSSLFSETTTDSISSLSNTINSTLKNVSRPSLFITTAKQHFPNSTTQSESFFLSTLINTPNAISTTLSPSTMASLLTPSPSAATSIPQGNTMMSLPKNHSTIYIPGIDTLNKSTLSSNKKSVSKPLSEIFFKISPEVILLNSIKAFPQPTAAATAPDRLSKNTDRLNSSLESSTITSFVSTESISTPTSNSAHVTGSKRPQTTHVSVTFTDNLTISVKSNSFISNNLTTTPSSVVGTSTPIFNTKTTAADNSFDISTNNDILLSMPPTKYIQDSSLIFANQGNLISPTTTTTSTTTETKYFPVDKQSEVTSSVVTTGTISNHSLSDITAKPFKSDIRTTTTGSPLETTTPFNSISKSTPIPSKPPSVPSKTATSTAPLTRPIDVIPVMTTNNRPFLELTDTHSTTSPTTIKSTQIPTTATKNEMSTFSITLTKSPKSLLSHFITASTKPVPFVKTNSRLIPGISKKSTLVPDLDSCFYNGRKYQMWDVFMSEDQCNTCECLYRGMVHCTELPCRDQKERMTSSVTQTTTPHLAKTRKNLSTTPVLEVIPCIYNGIHYNLWDVFPSVDGCNTCDCLYHGFVHCTDRQCTDHHKIPMRNADPPLISTPETCKYKNQVHQIGQTFLSEDKCTLCNCTIGGHISCTDIHCPSKDIHLNNRKTKLQNKGSPKLMVNSQPSMTFAPTTTTTTTSISTTTQMTTQAPVLKRAFCWYNGLSYKNGEKFNSEDNCKTCTCMSDSLVTCTQLACKNKNEIPMRNAEPFLISTLETCKYKNQVHQIGQTFLTEDKCTLCNCTIGGHISCTDIHCPSKDIQLSDRKTKLQNKESPKPKVNSRPSMTFAPTTTTTTTATTATTTTQMTTQAPVLKRAFCWYNGLSYKNGEKFNSEDNCNTCTCMSDSLVTCTQLACKNKNDLSDLSTCTYNGHIYQNGQMFNSADGCNTCGCLDGGAILCTSQLCKSVPAIINVSPVKCSYNKKVYNAGDVFNSTDNCNLCNCTQNGQVKCTQKTCRREQEKLQYDAPADLPVSVTCSFEDQSYKPKQVFQMADGCNVCTCTDDGRIICTNKKCPPNDDETKGKENSSAPFITTSLPAPSIPKSCIYDGQTFQTGDVFIRAKDGCNSCNCSLDGEIKCTQRKCPLNIGNFHAVAVTCIYEGEMYKPQNVFPSSDGCNTCTCSEIGRIHCTENLCTVKSKQSKGNVELAAKTISITTKVPILEKCSYNRRIYQIGDTFYSIDGCNMCNCSYRGVVTCDRKSCLSRNEEASKDVAMPLSAKVGITCFYEGQVYQPDRAYPSADKCNTCICSNKGQVHCTKTVCPDTKQSKDKPLRDGISEGCNFGGKLYTVGETFDLSDGCNICGCSDKGKILCTNRTCYPGILQNRESPQKTKTTTPIPQVTRPKKTLCYYNGHSYISGRIFKAADSCNMCGCLQNGMVHCTKNMCLSKIVQTTIPPPPTTTTSAIPLVKCRYFGQKYNVGQMFDVQNGCNMCACLVEGIVRCTQQRCEPPVVFCKHGGNVYFIGQTFAEDCNTCKCGAHGIITCTELHCGRDDDGRCNYNGQEHEHGETFRSNDGCHLCTCSSNMRISCRPVPSCQGPRNLFEFSSRERSEEEYLDD